MPHELTDRLMCLPKAIAVILRVPDKDMEEAVSEGYLALVKAANSWDPEKSNGSKFSSFAYNAIKWALLQYTGRSTKGTRHAHRWGKLGVLDSDVINGMSCKDDNSLNRIENGELIHKALRRLTPVEKAIYLLHEVQSVTITEISFRLNLTKQRTSQLLQKIEGKIETWRRLSGNGRRLIPGTIQNANKGLRERSEHRKNLHRTKLREGASRHRKQVAKANWLTGKVPQRDWFFLDETNKVVYGSAPRLFLLYAAIGVKLETVVRGGQAKRILAGRSNIPLVPIKGNKARELLNLNYKLRHLQELESKHDSQ